MGRKQDEVIALETKLKDVTAKLQGEIEQYKAVNSKMQDTLNKFHEKQRPELVRCEEMREELIQTRVNLEKNVGKLVQMEKELKEAKRTLHQENDTFLNMTRKLKEYKQHINRLTAENIKLQTDGTQMSLDYQHVGDNFTTALIRLKQTQASNAMLIEEIRQKDELLQDLNIRAAVAFGDFTPRPSLGDIATELGLEYASKDSTVEKCAKILTSVRKLRKRPNRSTIFGRKMLEAQSAETFSQDFNPY